MLPIAIIINFKYPVTVTTLTITITSAYPFKVQDQRLMQSACLYW